MDYTTEFECTTPKCDGQLIIPIKLIIQGKEVFILGRCPKCHVIYELFVPLKDRDLWISYIAPRFFMCDACGGTTSDNWKYLEQQWRGRYKFGLKNLIRVRMKCKICGKERIKITADPFWSETLEVLEGHAASLPLLEIKCPACGAIITEDTRTCPLCKLALICDKCEASLYPNANFCCTCGKPVERFEGTLTTPIDGICPVCNEEYEKGALFCGICGQELICDKCGILLQENTDFCMNCGDEIRKGHPNK